MMFPFFRKKIARLTSEKRDIPDGLWTKCPSCGEMVYRKQMHREHGVCAKCGFHFPLSCTERLEMLLEPKSFEEWDAGLESMDLLEFTGTSSYVSKLESNMKKTGRKDAVLCGKGRMGEHAVAFAVMDFDFLGASMGSVVGEKITRLIERGTAERLPVVIVCTSGGARMYEGLFSLMQMAKTSGALARHAAAGLPYIPVLTHPTMAGVMASFATLGDVIVAEPDALIGFAGPRVIKETTQQDLPDGFQKSEFLLKHGLLDMVVNRKELKSTLIQLLDYFRPSRPGEAKAS